MKYSSFLRFPSYLTGEVFYRRVNSRGQASSSSPSSHVVSCYRLVTNFQETNRQQETHARRDERTVIPKSISFAASLSARPLVLGAGPRTQGNLNSPSKGNFSVPPGGSLSRGTLLLSPSGDRGSAGVGRRKEKKRN